MSTPQTARASRTQPHTSARATGTAVPAARTPRHGTSGTSGKSSPATSSRAQRGQTRAGQLVRRLTRARRLIHDTLLADTRRHWTVQSLAEAVPALTTSTVRDNLNLLLAEGILEQIPHQRALTVALTGQGEQTLTVYTPPSYAAQFDLHAAGRGVWWREVSPSASRSASGGRTGPGACSPPSRWRSPSATPARG